MTSAAPSRKGPQVLPKEIRALPEVAPGVHKMRIGRRDCLVSNNPDPNVFVDLLGIEYTHTNPITGDVAAGYYDKDSALRTRDLVMVFNGFCVYIKGAADDIFDLGYVCEESRPSRRSTKKSVMPRFCECGCGGQPKGGRFLPGHDAKLMSRLRRESKSEDTNVRENALLQLRARRWA